MFSKIKKILSIIPLKLKLAYIGVCLLIICNAYFTTIISVKLGKVFDDISSGKISSLEMGLGIIINLAIVYILYIIFDCLRFFSLLKVLVVNEAYFKEKCVNQILNSPVSYHEECLSGERTSQIAKGISAFSQVVRMSFNGMLSSLLLVTFSIYEIFKLAPIEMVLVVIAFIIVYVTSSLIYAKYAKELNMKMVKLSNEFSGETTELIQNIEFVRAQDAFNSEKVRLKNKIDDIQKYSNKDIFNWSFIENFKGFMETVCLIGLIVLSCYYISKGTMLAGSAVAVCLLFRRLVYSLEPISFFATHLISNIIEIGMLVDLLTGKTDKVLSIQSKGNYDKNNKIIEFKDLVITNPKKDKVLAKYNHIIFNASKITALRGVTGAGKTTLIRALMRYYPTQNGNINIFGKDINDFSHSELTSLIYYVPQSSFFFKGTLKENLIYGFNKEFEDKMLIDVLKKMCLVGNISSGKKGQEIETEDKILGFNLLESAKNLSGGQRQRLTLSRALLAKLKLFIFDESSANIDSKTASIVLDNIEDYAKSINAGIVYISHDKNVVSRCTEVVDIKNEILDNTSNNIKDENLYNVI